VAQWHYSLQAAKITWNAFSWPTILSPLLNPPRRLASRPAGRMLLLLHRRRTLAAGLIFIDQMQPPQRVRFSPAPQRWSEALAYAIGMVFYIPFFTLQTHLSNGWCSRPGSGGERMAQAVRAAWDSLCRLLPAGTAREAAQAYAINFVLARVAMQMASVGAGSIAGGAFHRARGATLEFAPQPQHAPSLVERIAANPHAYVAASTAFWITNRIALNIERAGARSAAPTPAAATARLTTAVVLACVITAMVHPRDANQSGAAGI
jgi:hypothetical protein